MNKIEIVGVIIVIFCFSFFSGIAGYLLNEDERTNIEFVSGNIIKKEEDIVLKNEFYDCLKIKSVKDLGVVKLIIDGEAKFVSFLKCSFINDSGFNYSDIRCFTNKPFIIESKNEYLVTVYSDDKLGEIWGMNFVRTCLK